MPDEQRRGRAIEPVEGMSGGGGTGRFGAVERHVPGTNAQGGSLTVRWDNGSTGRHSACSLKVVTR